MPLGPAKSAGGTAAGRGGKVTGEGGGVEKGTAGGKILTTNAAGRGGEGWRDLCGERRCCAGVLRRDLLGL